MSVYFSPFVRQMQFDSWHERLQLQARRVNTALSAGGSIYPANRQLLLLEFPPIPPGSGVFRSFIRLLQIAA